MSITVTEHPDGSEWDELLDRTLYGTPFHRYRFLEICADYLGMTLHPYAGYKGQEPVGLFPIFELRRGPFSAAFSPPPRLKIPYLGPTLLDVEKLKPRKRERRNQEFVEAVLDAIDRDFSPRFTTVRTTPSYEDERPFIWSGFEATPRYTYLLDLTHDEEDLLAAFSKDARRAARTEVDGLEIEDANADDVERIVEGIASRHEEKGVQYSFSTPFASELYRELPGGVLRAHVCRHDRVFCGGELSFEYDGTVYGWQAVADVSRPFPVYDLMYWHVFRSAKERGCEVYDLVGANDRGLSTYKAKFAPELRTHQSLTRAAWYMKGAARAYARLR